MKIPVTVRNVTVHLWSIWKVDIEICVCEKNGKLFTVDLKTLETIVNQHLPSAPHDWNKQKGSKTKIQQRGDMNNTKLNESLENIFTIRKNGLNTPATNFIPLGFKFARWACTNLNRVYRSLFIVGLKWAEILAFISDLLLHQCTRQRSGMIRFE